MALNKIAVFGLGLLGGSIARALKKIDQAVQIDAYARHPHKIEEALKDQTIDRLSSLDDFSAAGIDLFIVAIPVVSSIDIIKKILSDPNLSEKSLIIDVGSVKGQILEEIANWPKANQFIGCHPMAGSEKTGYQNSSFDLYQGSTVIVTPQATNQKEDLEKVKSFWEKLGAEVFFTSALIHDQLVAYTSHLPHLISCLLVNNLKNYLGEKEDDDLSPFLGSGFKDLTRLASGSSQMWVDIFSLNKKNMLLALEGMKKELDFFKEMINKDSVSEQDLEFFLEKIKIFREQKIKK